MSESAASRPFSAISNGSAWQLARSMQNNTAKAQRHALCEYMPLRPCAISDSCKTRFTSRGGGIMAIYHCVFIHSAFELGLLAAKLRYICEMTKGMGKIFLKEVGVGKC